METGETVKEKWMGFENCFDARDKANMGRKSAKRPAFKEAGYEELVWR